MRRGSERRSGVRISRHRDFSSSLLHGSREPRTGATGGRRAGDRGCAVGRSLDEPRVLLDVVPAAPHHTRTGLLAELDSLPRAPGRAGCCFRSCRTLRPEAFSRSSNRRTCRRVERAHGLPDGQTAGPRDRSRHCASSTATPSTRRTTSSSSSTVEPVTRIPSSSWRDMTPGQRRRDCNGKADAAVRLSADQPSPAPPPPRSAAALHPRGWPGSPPPAPPPAPWSVHLSTSGRILGAIRGKILPRLPGSAEGTGIGGYVDGVFAEDCQRDGVQGAGVRRRQYDGSRGAGVVRLEPADRDHAPAITRRRDPGSRTPGAG